MREVTEYDNYENVFQPDTDDGRENAKKAREELLKFIVSLEEKHNSDETA